MVSMIEVLIEKGNAYVSEGHVLFDVNSYDAYGALSGRKLEDMRAGERVEVADYKRDPMDFVLWKPSSEDLPGWDSPWGRGRPGWHIECSAMSLDLLGATFDIHGGGLDLQFPHHENEIAQSCCANPDGGFANVWMHNEMIQVEGKKMSKSLGNFFTVKDLLDQGIPGKVIRFVLLSTHYRSPMDWTDKKVAEAKKTLIKWTELSKNHAFSNDGHPHISVVEALSDDLNTPGAFAAMHDLAKKARSGDYDSASALYASMEFFELHDMIYMDDIGQRIWKGLEDRKSPGVIALVENLLSERDEARKAKNYTRADRIRDGFIEAGVIVEDSTEKTSWKLSDAFNLVKLEALK